MTYTQALQAHLRKQLPSIVVLEVAAAVEAAQSQERPARSERPHASVVVVVVATQI